MAADFILDSAIDMIDHHVVRNLLPISFSKHVINRMM
jgi:hypothetical protein